MRHFYNLTVAQIFKKYSHFLWYLKIFYRNHRSLALNLVVKQFNPVHNFTWFLLKIKAFFTIKIILSVFSRTDLIIKTLSTDLLYAPPLRGHMKFRGEGGCVLDQNQFCLIFFSGCSQSKVKQRYHLDIERVLYSDLSGRRQI